MSTIHGPLHFGDDRNAIPRSPQGERTPASSDRSTRATGASEKEEPGTTLSLDGADVSSQLAPIAGTGFERARIKLGPGKDGVSGRPGPRADRGGFAEVAGSGLAETKKSGRLINGARRSHLPSIRVLLVGGIMRRAVVLCVALGSLVLEGRNAWAEEGAPASGSGSGSGSASSPASASTPVKTTTAQGPVIELRASDPRAVIERKTGSSSPSGVPFAETSFFSVGHWEHACVAPCQLELDPKFSYRVSGDGLVPTDSFTIPRGRDRVRFEAKMGSSTGRLAGILLTGAGAVSAGIGEPHPGERRRGQPGISLGRRRRRRDVAGRGARERRCGPLPVDVERLVGGRAAAADVRGGAAETLRKRREAYAERDCVLN